MADFKLLISDGKIGKDYTIHIFYREFLIYPSDSPFISLRVNLSLLETDRLPWKAPHLVRLNFYEAKNWFPTMSLLHWTK